MRINPHPDDSSSPRELLRLGIAVISGAFAGAIIVGGIAGYMQLLEDFSGSLDIDITWIFLAVFVGGLGGAAVGAVIGLITGLILVTRSTSHKVTRLR